MKHWLKKALIGFLCMLTCVAGAFGMVACGDDSSSSSSSSSNSSSSSSSEQTHTHEYTETVLAQATCTSEGLKKLVCTCGDEKEEKIEKLPHVEVDDEAVPATCLSTGLTAGKHCDECGEIIVAQTPTEKLKHTFTKQDTASKYLASAATCQANETYYYSCKDCGEKGTETFEKADTMLSHVWESNPDVEYIKTAATCTAQAVYYKSCEKCHEKGTETFTHGALARHDFTNKDTADKYLAGQAACNVNATYYYSCVACGEASTETFEKEGSALKHDYVGTLVEPSCLVDGYNVYTCSRCQDTYSDLENMIPATGHSYTEDVTPATCTTQGYTTFTCSCGDSYVGAYTPKAAHNYTTTTIPSTCNEKGYDLHVCGCGDTKKDNYQELAEHAYTVVETKPATCQEEGELTYTYTCACNKTLTEPIAKVAHRHKAGTPVAPTCTEQGYTPYVCKYKNCNDTYNADFVAATGHQAYTSEITKPATCETAGELTYTCPDCGQGYIETVAATGHAHAIDRVVEPTCEEQGYTVNVCTNEGCGHSYNDNYVPATGHSYGVANEVEATCDATGYTEYSCLCGHSYQEEIPATGHVLEENKWELVTDDNGETVLTHREGCTYFETYQQVCGSCGEIIEKEKDVVKHNHVVSITKVATCQGSGVKTFTCSCGDTYTQEYSVNVEEGHQWSAPQATGGVETVSCLVKDCEAKKTTLKADGTDATVNKTALAQTGEIQMDAATIKMDEATKSQLTGGEGSLDIHASKLSETDKNDLMGGIEDEALKDKLKNQPVFNFTVANGAISKFDGTMTVTVPYDLNGQDAEGICVYFIGEDGQVTEIRATYTEIDGKGYATFETDHFSTYTVVRLTPSERCALYGHDWHDRKVEATCTTDGYYIEFCVRCGTNVTIEMYTAYGHNFTEFTKDPTCTEKGYVGHICQNEGCGYQYKDNYVEANGHSYAETQIESTCIAKGYTKKTCTVCQNTYNTNYVEALGHDYQNSVVEPTCEAQGYIVHACARMECRHTYNSDFVAATGHTYEESEVKAPTCVQPGYTTYKCKDCEKSYNSDYVAAKGHDYGNGEKHEATCQEEGYTYYECADCGNNYKAKYEPKTKHQYGEGEKQEATCYVKGYTRYACLHCDAYYDDEYEDKLEHEYEEQIVAPTCVAKGYTLHTCKNPLCGDSYKDNYVNALGHNYGVDFLCTICGAEHPDLSHGKKGFYQTLVGSIVSTSSYYVTIEDWVVTQQTTSEGKIYNLSITEIEIVELSYAFDKNGYMVGQGLLKMTMTQQYDGREMISAGTVQMVLVDGKVYICSQESNYDATYMVITQELAESSMGFPLFTLHSLYLQQYSANAASILATALGFTDAEKEQTMGAITEFLFVKTETGEGYSFTLNAEQLYNALEQATQKTVKELFDSFFGVGAFDGLTDWVIAAMDQTVADVETQIEANLVAAGYELDDLYDLLDEAIAMIAGAQGAGMDVRAMIEQMKTLKVGDLIAQSTGMTANDFKGMIAQIKEMCAQTDIVSLIAFMSGNAQTPEEAAKYASELLKQFEGIMKYIGDTEIVLSTDKDGNAGAISFKLDIAMQMAMSGDSDGSSGQVYINTIEISGTGKITLNGSKDLGLADLKEFIDGIFENVDLEDGVRIPTEDYGDRILYRNGDKLLLAYDVETLMRMKPAEMQEHGVEEIGGVMCQKYTVMWTDIYSEHGWYTMACGIYAEKEFAMSSNGSCGDWVEYNLSGDGYYVYYDIWVTQEGYIVKSEINWDKLVSAGEMWGVTFWYNTKTDAIQAESPHDYQLTDSQYAENCGEYNVETYTCSHCGDIYVDEWKNHHVFDSKYELVEGALSCEDGVVCTNYCIICGEVESSYIDNDHRANWIRGTIETACGKVEYTFYSCACGYGCDGFIYLSGECQFERSPEQNYGDKENGDKDPNGREDRYAQSYVCHKCGMIVWFIKTVEYTDCYEMGSIVITVNGNEVFKQSYKEAIHRHNTYMDMIDENGGYTQKDICYNCGVTVEERRYDAQNRIIYKVNENGFGYRREFNGCDYVEYAITPKGETKSHEGTEHSEIVRYEHRLIEGAKSCVDGVYVVLYCTCCGEEIGYWGEVYSNEHSFNEREEIIYTPCGSVTVIYGVCACGQQTAMLNVMENGCTLEYNEEDMFVCTTCGLRGTLDYVVTQDGCTQIQSFTASLYMGGSNVPAWTLSGYQTRTNHDMVWVSVSNPDGGYTKIYQCANCSYFEEKYTYDVYGREIRYERSNGAGYFYVYEPNCSYSYYTFDRDGEYYQYSDTEHRTEMTGQFATSVQNCEAGVIISYRCIICGELEKSYPTNWHEEFRQLVYEGQASCGKVSLYKYSCLCGQYGNGSMLEGKNNCKFKEKCDWLEDTDTLFERTVITYTCEDCGFTYTCYTYTEQVQCTTYYRAVYHFNVQEDGSYEQELSMLVGSYTYHENERTEEGASDDGVYVYYRYCAICGEAMEHWERKTDEHGRETYYMDRLAGKGWERVYSTTNCSYVQYELNQAGERGEQTEGFYHAENWQRYELMDGAENCREGVWGINYCSACGMEENRWEDYEHLTFAHRKYFVTDCGKMLFTYWECACGEKQETYVYIDGSCNMERVWDDEEYFPDGENGKYEHWKNHFNCVVTACGFNYTYEQYYAYKTTESCQATYVVIYKFYDGNTLLYEKTLERDVHRMVSVYVEEKYNGVNAHGYRCKYCDYAQLYDEYGREVYYWNPYEGEFGWGYRTTWTGCDYYREYFNCNGLVYTESGTDHHWYTKEIYEACTQYGSEIRYCNVCNARDEYDYVPPRHAYEWNDQEQTYICNRCGLKNEKGVDGDFLVEDLTYQYGGYTVGFFNRLGLEWKLEDGYNFYIMFNYKVDANGTPSGILAQGVTYDLFEYGYDIGQPRSGIISLNMDSLEAAIKAQFGEDRVGFETVSVVFQSFDKYDPVGGTYSYLDHVLTFGV